MIITPIRHWDRVRRAVATTVAVVIFGSSSLLALLRGASPRRPSLHTRLRGPHDPRSARVAHSLALVRAMHVPIRRVFATGAALVIGGNTSLLACPMCFGAEETTMIDGTKLGIVAMLGITFVVQGGFVGFFLYLRRRAKRMAELELDAEWAELQRPSRTS